MQVNMRRLPWPSRSAAVAAAILAVLGAVYWYTVEPAPAVKVRWRDGVTAGQRAALQRRFRLVDPIAAEGRTITYNLLDTSRRNLQAIVAESAVEDTSEFDRIQLTLPADAPYGTRWTWLANRLPVTRLPGVMAAVVTACLLVLGLSALRAVRARRLSASEPGPAPRL
jgi:hypothetical protein